MNAVVSLVQFGDDNFEDGRELRLRFLKSLLAMFSFFSKAELSPAEQDALVGQIRDSAKEVVVSPVRFQPSSRIPGGAQFCVTTVSSSQLRNDRLSRVIRDVWKEYEDRAGWSSAKRMWDLPDEGGMEAYIEHMQHDEKREAHYQFVHRLVAGPLTEAGRNRHLWRLMQHNYAETSRKWQIELPRATRKIHDPGIILRQAKEKGLFRWSSWESFVAQSTVKCCRRHNTISELDLQELWKLQQLSSLQAVEHACRFGLPRGEESRQRFIQRFLFPDRDPSPEAVSCDARTAIMCTLGQASHYPTLGVEEIVVQFCAKLSPEIAYACIGLVAPTANPFHRACLEDFYRNAVLVPPDGAVGVQRVVFCDGDKDEAVEKTILDAQ